MPIWFCASAVLTNCQIHGNSLTLGNPGFSLPCSFGKREPEKVTGKNASISEMPRYVVQKQSQKLLVMELSLHVSEKYLWPDGRSPRVGALSGGIRENGTS